MRLFLFLTIVFMYSLSLASQRKITSTNPKEKNYILIQKNYIGENQAVYKLEFCNSVLKHCEAIGKGTDTTEEELLRKIKNRGTHKTKRFLFSSASAALTTTVGLLANFHPYLVVPFGLFSGFTTYYGLAPRKIDHYEKALLSAIVYDGKRESENIYKDRHILENVLSRAN